MPRIGEKILRALSRHPDTEDYQDPKSTWTGETALDTLRTAFPGFDSLVADKQVLDFGCGTGWQSVALAKGGAHHVVGVDINTAYLQHARTLAAEWGLGPDQVRFEPTVPAPLQGSFDIVISQNSMEHFPDPGAVLTSMKHALRSDGRVLITFGEPWFAPYGSHMHFFTRVPWVNVLFSEKTVMRVRQTYRNDGATSYEDVESGLNRMTVRKFERLTRECDLAMAWRAYDCVKGITVLGKIPYAREFFINNIRCVLETAPAPEG